MIDALEVRNLRKDYGDFLLDDVSFTLPSGFIMGLIGPNGAGKTTIIKSIMGLVRADGGSIRIFGNDPKQDGVATRARIGFVYDEPKHYPHLSLGRLGSLVAPFYDRWDDELFHRLARQFELPLRKPIKKFSRGMVTKAALALALSHDAELIVMDEPTSGLDPVFRRELLEILGESMLDGRRSVLFSTHITSDLERVADFITFIRKGEIVFTRRCDDVRETYAVVRGSKDLLSDETRSLFEGVRPNDFGFEALTADTETARRIFGDQVVIERASLDEIMFLTGKGMD